MLSSVKPKSHSPSRITMNLEIIVVYTYILLRMKRIALQRNNNLRQQFKADISVFNHLLVFLDQTGIVSIKLYSSCVVTFPYRQEFKRLIQVVLFVKG